MEQNKETSNSNQSTSPEKEKYIWFGVYNELLLNENISQLFNKLVDKSLPKESAAIHLNKFSISFHKNKIFITYKENSSIFIKLYLILKTQFIDILKKEYNCNNKIDNESENIFKLQKTNDELVLDPCQDENNFYNTLKNIGTFNDISIYSVTSRNNIVDLQPPDKDYLNQIYIGLKKSFYLYSDYLIMYYLYLVHEIKTTYSLKKLIEIFIENKKETKDENKNNIVIKEIDNQKQLWHFLSKNDKNKTESKEDINEYNYILNMEALPEFDETTGEFFWNNNDSNWEKVNQKINNNSEIKNKVVDVENGSIFKLVEESQNKDEKSKEKGNEISENEKNSQKKNTLKYIEELSGILDTK